MARILPSGAAFRRRIVQPAPIQVGPVPRTGPKELLEGLQFIEALAGSKVLGAVLAGLGYVGEQAVAGVRGLLDEPDLDEAAEALAAKGVSLEDLQASIPQDMAAAPGVDAAHSALLPGGIVGVPDLADEYVVESRQLLQSGMTPADVAQHFQYRGDVPTELVPEILAKARPEPTERDAIQSQVVERVAKFLQGGGAKADAIATMVDRGATPDEARQIVQSAMAQIAETPEPVRPPHQAEVMAALQQGVDPAQILDALVKRDIGDTPADVLTMAARREEAQSVIDEARGALGPAASVELMAREDEVAAVQVGGFGEALALAASADTPEKRTEAVAMAERHAPMRTILDYVFPGPAKLAAAKAAEALMPRAERIQTAADLAELQSKAARREAKTQAEVVRAEQAKSRIEQGERRLQMQIDKAAAEAKTAADRLADLKAKTAARKASTRKIKEELKAKNKGDSIDVKTHVKNLLSSVQLEKRSLNSMISSFKIAAASNRGLAGAKEVPKRPADVLLSEWAPRLAAMMERRATAGTKATEQTNEVTAAEEKLTKLNAKENKIQKIRNESGLKAYLDGADK